MVALLYLAIWISPNLFSAAFIFSMSLLMLLEFIMIHSGVFMTIFKPFGVFLFFPFYFFFAYIINKICPDNSPMFVFLGTILFRVIDSFVDRGSKKISIHDLKSIIIAFAIYFPIFALTALLNDFMPHFGLTPSYLESIDYYSTDTSTGDFKIHNMISFGFFYFMAIICFEMWLRKKYPPQKNKLIVADEV